MILLRKDTKKKKNEENSVEMYLRENQSKSNEWMKVRKIKEL